MPHRARESVTGRVPVHVTWRLLDGLPSLRSATEFAVITRACEDVQAAREGFRVVHFTVMGDHVHMLVEGESRDELSSALASLTICWAKRLNRLWRRKGVVFPDRRHEHVLRGPREGGRSKRCGNKDRAV